MELEKYDSIEVNSLKKHLLDEIPALNLKSIRYILIRPKEMKQGQTILFE